MYYRIGTLRFDFVRRAEGMRPTMFAAMNSLTNALVTEDTAAWLGFFDAQDKVRPGGIGCIGYCMSGRYVTTVAARFPNRFAASASLYGVGIVTNAEDSPHLLIDRIKGEMYFGFAETDEHVRVTGRVTSSFRPVLVLHERKSRVTLAARLAGKTAAETISVMLAVFARVDPALRKSITFDNDTAFAQHALLRTMRAMTTWFCDAYASWQKGGVENANGRLRRWLPRQIDIDKVSDEEIQDIVMTANLTPRKCLGFKTPLQAILKELGKDVQIRFA